MVFKGRGSLQRPFRSRMDITPSTPQTQEDIAVSTAQKRIDAALAPTHQSPQPPVLRRSARPEISDREFDRLIDELQELEASIPNWSRPTVRRRRVGGEPIEGFVSVRHRVPMLSIDNTYSAGDLREFDRRVPQAAAGRDGPVRRRTEDRRRGHFADVRKGRLHPGGHAATANRATTSRTICAPCTICRCGSKRTLPPPCSRSRRNLHDP